jgi:purine-nucleoside phosphorylase
MRAKDQRIIANVFGCTENAIAENVIVTFEDRLNHFAELMNAPAHFRSWWRGITGTYEGTPISVLVCGMGASQAGDCVMFLGHTQCRRLLFSGSAGALNSASYRGDLIVVKEAIIGEGFSPYFSRGESVLASSELVSKTKAYCASRNTNLHEGVIFTTGSLYAETRPFLISVRERGADYIDMETSAIFTAAAHKNILAAAVHYISDLPLAEESTVHQNGSLRKVYSQMPHLLLELMKYFSIMEK